MPGEHSKQVGFDSRYVAKLLLDESNIKSRDYTAGIELLRKYSNIPEDQLVFHVTEIQHRAYALCPYPCIGLLRFLVCSLSAHPLYSDILARLAQDASLVDLGCCFAQDIRKLAYDGAPTRNCTAVDLEPRFFDISEDLFRDHGRLEGSFVGADIFDAEEKLWTKLEGSVDIVHASSLFHLFGLERQRRIACLTSRLVKPAPGSLVLGLQLAAKEKAEHIPIVNEQEPSFCHSSGSMQAMWDDAGREVGLTAGGALRWQVDLTPRDVPDSHRIGLLSDMRLTEVLWVAKLVEGAGC
ncbi:MAG: hypothetical protein LQ348_001886 [Seirophora lacunosa]|nr:MAG: hypothetical protein LQ348_001886 [Seirophora lacunosa]